MSSEKFWIFFFWGLFCCYLFVIFFPKFAGDSFRNSYIYFLSNSSKGSFKNFSRDLIGSSRRNVFKNFPEILSTFLSVVLTGNFPRNLEKTHMKISSGILMSIHLCIQLYLQEFLPNFLRNVVRNFSIESSRNIYAFVSTDSFRNTSTSSCKNHFRKYLMNLIDNIFQ